MPDVLDVEKTDVMLIAVEKVLQEQAEDPFCEQAAETVEQPGHSMTRTATSFQSESRRSMGCYTASSRSG